jgi:hypothetical protein
MAHLADSKLLGDPVEFINVLNYLVGTVTCHRFITIAYV